MPSQDRGSPPCSSLADPTENTNQGGQAPGNLPPNHGPRLGKEEGETRILAGANVAPTSALSGQGLLSLLQEPPIFSFSGTGGIYFLCHFGGCLPCQRLFCRVKKDKKVVSRLFGGGREDCLVRERGLLRSAQPHAALPLWLQSVPSPLPLVPLPVGPRWGQESCPSPELKPSSPGMWETRPTNAQTNTETAKLSGALREPFSRACGNKHRARLCEGSC